MLLSYLDGKIPMSKTIRKYLDMCTSCGACTKFCPSGIDASKFLTLQNLKQKIFHLNFCILERLFFLAKIVTKCYNEVAHP